VNQTKKSREMRIENLNNDINNTFGAFFVGLVWKTTRVSFKQHKSDVDCNEVRPATSSISTPRSYSLLYSSSRTWTTGFEPT
jgi:3'-phosphoadenosine 5'-phosphosulfate sulfotransferase